jgi:hypothetical protein
LTYNPGMAESMLDTTLPDADVSARWQLCVDAPVERVYQAACALPIMHTVLAHRLLVIRALPARLDPRASPEDDSVFIWLGEVPAKEVVFGFAGRFWHPSRNIIRLGGADAWRRFEENGSAKAAVNILVEPLGNGQTRLSTETRVICFGASARRIFRLYWLMTAPFSGWIRKDWLRSFARANDETSLERRRSGSPPNADEQQTGVQCPH